MELSPVAIAKYVGGIGPHDVRAWPDWAAADVLIAMRAEATNS